jgi:outer membrane protein assembly factor BamB
MKILQKVLSLFFKLHLNMKNTSLKVILSSVIATALLLHIFPEKLYSAKYIKNKSKEEQTAPLINISSNKFNYSNRRVNSLSGFTFLVTNTGSSDLAIYSVAFQTSYFKFDTINSAFPVLIKPGEERTLRIWFCPTAALTYSDKALITSNAVNSPNLNIDLAGTGVNLLTELGDIFWEGNIPPNPNTTNQDYQPKSIKQIPDVNNDGINDVIIATGNYWTICYNGNSSVTADTLWKFNTHFGSINTGSVTYKDAVQIIQDIDNDLVPDVIIGCGGGNEMVYALSGRTGRRIWAYGDSIGTSDGDINGLRTNKDYNSDGINDVVIAASGEANMSGRHALVCVNGLNGQVLFFTQLTSNFTHDVVNLGTYGGAIDFSNNGTPYGVRGFNNSGNLTWTYSLTSTIWSLRDFSDINGDGVRDVIGFWGFSSGVFAISGADGSQVWATSLGSGNNGTVEILDDKDKNGFADLICSGPQAAFRLDSKTGQMIWTYPTGSSYLRDVDMLGDVSSDTLAEVLVATQQPGRVYVLNGQNGDVFFMYEFGQSISYRADKVAKLNSIDANQTNEFVAGCRDGRIKCFSGGDGTIVGIKPVSNQIPGEFELFQNYPNPFNPVTKIRFSVPNTVSPLKGGRRVILSIYDILGCEITTLVNEHLKPGTYEVEWNASEYPSGVYFYILNADGFIDTKRMILIK